MPEIEMNLMAETFAGWTSQLYSSDNVYIGSESHTRTSRSCVFMLRLGSRWFELLVATSEGLGVVICHMMCVQMTVNRELH